MLRGYGNTAIGAVTVVSLCAGAWLLSSGSDTNAPPQPSAAEARPDPAVGRTAARALPPSPPDRIRIPAIHVNAPLMGLKLTSTGSLDVPPAAKKNLAGWYEAGTTPVRPARRSSRAMSTTPTVPPSSTTSAP